jgi:hypothetical protein
MNREPAANSAKMDKRQTMILALALAIVVFTTACSKSPSNANNSNSTANSANTNSSSAASTTTGGGGAIKAAYTAFYEAGKRGDIQGVKRGMSAGTLKMLEEGAKKQGKSVDEALKADMNVPARLPEMENEKIDGDTATLDLKDEDGTRITMPFVKENGEWKVAVDKLMRQLGGPSGSGEPGAQGQESDGQEKAAPQD